MATEIERKFLLKNDTWRHSIERSVPFRQGYLIGAEQASVRVRLEGDKAKLNIKGATVGVSRLEYEYPIPIADAEELLDSLCGSVVEKVRYFVRHGGLLWEIDEFSGDNAGLIVAEVELESENQLFELPEWAGEEVSHDVRYYNAALAKRPFNTW